MQYRLPNSISVRSASGKRASSNSSCSPTVVNIRCKPWGAQTIARWRARRVMHRLTKSRMLDRSNRERGRLQRRRGPSVSLPTAALTIIMMALSACGGGGGGSGDAPPGATLTGNWQFTMAPQTDGVPDDPTFTGGLEGGFL